MINNTTAIDSDSRERILAIPWLAASVRKKKPVEDTGRRPAHVILHQVPKRLSAMAFVASDNNDELEIVMYRWDRYAYQGWESFPLIVEFPSTSSSAFLEFDFPASYNLDDEHTFRIPVPSSASLQERPLQQGRVIPRTIFNLSAPLVKQHSEEHRRSLEVIRSITDVIQGDSLYLIIDDDAGLREVEEASHIPHFAEAYKAVKPGSYKADLLRYYLLYQYGGVYLDDKSILRFSLDSDVMDAVFIDPDTNIPNDLFIGLSGSTPEIAFMGARRGSPIMRAVLDAAITNIMNREYGYDRLSITGNTLFKNVIEQQYEFLQQERVKFLKRGLVNEAITVDSELVWYRQAIPVTDWPKSYNYYWNLWGQREVFVDRNPRPNPLNQLICLERTRNTFIGVLIFCVILLVGFIINSYPQIW